MKQPNTTLFTHVIAILIVHIIFIYLRSVPGTNSRFVAYLHVFCASLQLLLIGQKMMAERAAK